MKQTARELQAEIQHWAQYNFCYQDKIGLGMGEELGEFCHNKLKFLQKIRGHSGGGNEAERLSKYLTELQDACGDAMVFCLHWAENNDAFISFEKAKRFCNETKFSGEMEIVGHAYQCVGRMFILGSSEGEFATDEAQHIAQRYFDLIAVLCKNFGWDFQEVLKETWDQVKTRDFIRFPKNGRP